MKYFTKLYQGRITRKEYLSGYFFFSAVLFVAVFLLAIPFGILQAITGQSIEESPLFQGLIVGGVITMIVAFYVAMFSLFVRRLHDIGKSGWWCIPPLTNFVALFLIFIGSDKANKYGKVPESGRNFFKTILGLE